ncbi:MAG: SURF1 family protein [Hyphomonadaceae bacterium]
MYFRPLPFLTILVAACVAALCALGAWQWSRATWKSGLIEEARRHAEAEPQSLHDAVCAGQAGVGALIRIEDVQARVADAPEVRMFGRSVDGVSGWRVLKTVRETCPQGDAVVLAEAGFDPLDPQGMPSKPLRLLALAPWPAKSTFAPPNDPADDDWHWFDHAALAEALSAPDLADAYYLEAFDGVPVYLLQVPPSRHIGYSITWYGMAIALLAIYAVVHVRAGRLRIGRRARPES